MSRFSVHHSLFILLTQQRREPTHTFLWTVLEKDIKKKGCSLSLIALLLWWLWREGWHQAMAKHGQIERSLLTGTVQGNCKDTHSHTLTHTHKLKRTVWAVWANCAANIRQCTPFYIASHAANHWEISISILTVLWRASGSISRRTNCQHLLAQICQQTKKFRTAQRQESNERNEKKKRKKMRCAAMAYPLTLH